MTDHEREGHIWSAIRMQLSNEREQMAKAIEAQQYEIESVYFDGIARRLAQAVTLRLRELEGKQ